MGTTRTYRSSALRRTLVLMSVAISSILWGLAFALSSLAFATAAVVVTGTTIALLVRTGSEPTPVTETSAEVAVETQDHPDFIAPSSLEPKAVVHSLLENGRILGLATSAHLWFVDPGSNTLRLVYSDGIAMPTPISLDIEDSLLGKCVRDDEVVVGEIARVTTPRTGTTTTIRVAFPITSGDIGGVAAIDYSEQAPEGVDITRLGVSMRLPLASALGLHMARTRTDEAVSLIEAARELSRTLDPPSVLSLALDRAMAMSDAATGSVMLLDSETSTLTIASAHGLPEEVVDSTSLSVGEGIAGWVAASGNPVLIEDLPGDKPTGKRHGVRSAVSVPMSDEDGLVGVINVGSRAFPARFTTEHLDALEMLGRQTAVAWRNASAVNQAGEMYFDTLKTLALALETKDPYAAGGTERIVEYTTLIARSMNLADADVKAIEIASLLHDVGMTALGPMCAGSARPLSVMEQGLLKMHPTIAADILDQAPALRQVAPIVYHHHERFDGSGYVAGLKGQEIPLGARILSVADAYVAMTSERPYRDAKSSVSAIDELLRNAGTQFDPDVVRVFVDLLRSDPNRVPQADA